MILLVQPIMLACLRNRAQISGISGTLLVLKYIFKIDGRHEGRPGDLVCMYYLN